MRLTRTAPALAAALTLAWATSPARAQYYPPTYPAYGPGGYGFGAGQVLQGNAALTNATGQYANQLEQARLMREQVNQAKLDTKKKAIDFANYERANKVWFSQEQEKNEQMRVRRLLNQPLQSEITNGSALNMLLPYLQSLVVHGAGAPVPISADIIKAINVTVGNSEANAGLLRDGGRLSWPFVLRGPAQKHVDTILPTAVSAAVGGTLDGSLLNEVTKSVDAVQKELFTKFQNEEIVGGDYLTGKRYLESLRSAIEVLKQPNPARFLGGTYKASGANVPELVFNMTSKGLRFAPATPGDEAAYLALFSSVQAFSASAGPSDSGFRVRLGPGGQQASMPKQ